MPRLLLLLLMVSAGLLAGCSPAPAPTRIAAAPVSHEPPYKWTQGAAPRAYRDMVATFHRAGLSTGEYVWASTVPEEGEARVVIDLVTQMAYAYRGDRLIGAASVSSAKTGKVTPLGFWKVLQKSKFYRSKKYNNAPMPFMQRLDDYGIALHGGPNPGFPASHGCIRMPMKFAEKLFGVTRLGSAVVIEG